MNAALLSECSLLHSHSDSDSLDKLCWVGEPPTLVGWGEPPTLQNLSRQARRVTDDRRLILIVFIEQLDFGVWYSL